MRSIFFLFVLLSFKGVSQNIKRSKNNQVKDTNCIYMVCRGTYSKSTLIAKNFNLKDPNITHSGLGLFSGGNLLIYNVIENGNKDSSALIIDSFSSFRKSPDVYYVSIWKCELDDATLEKAKILCRKYYDRKIVFDVNFNINLDDTLYCSEFCSRILQEIKCRKVSCKSSQIVLNNTFYESLLNRKKLTYFPVDFFETNNNFKKVYEWKSTKQFAGNRLD